MIRKASDNPKRAAVLVQRQGLCIGRRVSIIGIILATMLMYLLLSASRELCGDQTACLQALSVSCFCALPGMMPLCPGCSKGGLCFSALMLSVRRRALMAAARHISYALIGTARALASVECTG
jgi:hypothetical protein